MELAEAEVVDEQPDKNAQGRLQKNFTEIKDRTGAVLHRIEGGARERLHLAGIYLRGAQLQGAMLRGANFRDSDLREADLSDADLEGAMFDDARLDNANLTRANLRKTQFTRVSACKAIFNLADLTQSSWEKANLEEASFIRANLEGLKMDRLPLQLANFFEAHLRGSEFSFCDLSSAEFQGADLSCATISCSNLGGARLVNAKVRGAVFETLQLEGAALYGLDFRALKSHGDLSFGYFGACFDRSTRWPMLSPLPIKASGVYFMFWAAVIGGLLGFVLGPFFLLTSGGALVGYVLWRMLSRASEIGRYAIHVEQGNQLTTVLAHLVKTQESVLTAGQEPVNTQDGGGARAT